MTDDGNGDERGGSIPGRLIGSGARAGKAIAGATGLDRAAEAATEDAIVAALESPALERALERFVEGEAFERTVEAMLQSPAVERAVVKTLESPMSDRVWERLLTGEKTQALIARVAEAPEVRQAVAAQGVGLIEDIGRQLRRISDHLDDFAESVARRLFRRPPRTEPTTHAGLITRFSGLVIDAVILNAVFVLSSALLFLGLNSLFQSLDSWPELAIGTVAWILALSIYFFVFWTLAGQTPGMRFLGIRLVAIDGDGPPGPRAARRRLIGFALSVLTLGYGFLMVLFSDDRRGLADRRAGTDVVRIDLRPDSS